MKPRLVFLHGIGGSARGWDPQVRHFESRFMTLAWNAPGYGGRACQGAFTFERLATVLADDLDAFGIERAALVGHSFGGMIAQQFVNDHPQRVTHLVLANTSAAFGNPEGEFQRRFIEERLAPLDKGLGMPALAEEAVARMTGDAADADGLALARRSMATVPEASYRAAIRLLVTFDLRSSLASIRIPTLAIAGEKDTQSPAPMMRRMAERIPGASFIEFAGAGHLLPFERPQAFNEALDAFLASARSVIPAEAEAGNQ